MSAAAKRRQRADATPFALNGDRPGAESAIAARFSRSTLAPVEKPPAPFRGAEDRNFVEALARGIELLEVFARRGRPLTNGDLHEISGLSKATVSRLTYTLQMLGYIRRRPSGDYEAMPRTAIFARAVQSAAPILSAPHARLADLAINAPVCVVLLQPHVDEMIVTQAYNAHRDHAPHILIGDRADLFRSAAGHAWLASLDARSLKHAIARLPDAARSAAAEAAAMAASALSSDGFCFCAHGWRHGYVEVAAPLLGAGAAFPEAWACAIGPDTRANRLLLKETIGPRLAGLGVT